MRINYMSVPKRVKRTRVLSTKVTERDNRYMQLMVNRYYEERRIHQAKTSTLLRLIVKIFLRKDVPITNRRHLPVISKKLVSCIQPEKVIVVFLTLIYSKRHIPFADINS